MALICPVCKQKLVKTNQSYGCSNNHNFDVSKTGYTNLLLKNSQESGDNKAMVQARSTFLELGFYEKLRTAILQTIQDLQPKVLVDAGCGEGYYSNELKKILDGDIFAFDLSKTALNYASKQSSVRYFLNSVFDLPLQDQSIDCILSVFAPVATSEFKRILNDKGSLIVVSPNKQHLLELKEVLYDQVRLNDVSYVEGFTCVEEQQIEYKMSLSKDQLSALYLMTPYSYKSSVESFDKLQQVKQLDVTASFRITTYTKEKSR